RCRRSRRRGSACAWFARPSILPSSAVNARGGDVHGTLAALDPRCSPGNIAQAYNRGECTAHTIAPGLPARTPVRRLGPCLRGRAFTPALPLRSSDSGTGMTDGRDDAGLRRIAPTPHRLTDPA